MVTFNYNVNEVQPTGTYDPLPSGWYVAQITETEAKVPKSGQGKMLCVTYEIIDGEYRGRKVWSNFCFEHPNAEAQRIARGHISAISHAVGLPHCNESEQLHHVPLKIKVALDRDRNGDELVNKITGYAAADRIKPAQQKPADPAAGHQAEGGTPPWLREPNAADVPF